MKKFIRSVLPSTLRSLPATVVMSLILVPAVSLAGGLFYIDSTTGFAGFGNTDPQSQVDVSGAIYSRLVTATSSTVDWNQGNVQKETLSSSPTFTFSNAQAGGQYTLLLKQDSTGGRAVTWPVSVVWPNGTTPTLTSTPGAVDALNFTYDGSNYYGSSNLNYSGSSPLLTDIAAYFKFSGDSNDATAHAYNGTDTNIAYNSSYGKIGEGASFDGSTSVISMPSGVYSLFDGSNSWTINEWIQLPSIASEQTFFSACDATNGSNVDCSVRFYIDPTVGSLDAFRGDGSGLDEITSTAGITPNTWYMATLTYDGTNLNLYLNGTSAATAVASSRTAVTATRANLGNQIGYSNEYWSGYMDEAGFWSRALSPTEISALYASGSGDQYPF